MNLPSSAIVRPAYAPSAGTSLLGSMPMLAVGKPSRRPTLSPASTGPAIEYSRPRSRFASSISPIVISRRTSELCSSRPSIVYGGTTSTSWLLLRRRGFDLGRGAHRLADHVDMAKMDSVKAAHRQRHGPDRAGRQPQVNLQLSTFSGTNVLRSGSV